MFLERGEIEDLLELKEGYYGNYDEITVTNGYDRETTMKVSVERTEGEGFVYQANGKDGSEITAEYDEDGYEVGYSYIDAAEAADDYWADHYEDRYDCDYCEY